MPGIAILIPEVHLAASEALLALVWTEPATGSPPPVCGAWPAVSHRGVFEARPSANALGLVQALEAGGATREALLSGAIGPTDAQLAAVSLTRANARAAADVWLVATFDGRAVDARAALIAAHGLTFWAPPSEF